MEELKNNDTPEARVGYSQYLETARNKANETEQAYQNYRLNAQMKTGLYTSDNRVYTFTPEEAEWVSSRYKNTFANGVMPHSSYSKYNKKSKYDAWALQMGMPSEKEIDKYLSAYSAYKGNGGLKDVYGGVSESQWKKIGELWSKDWEYGLTDEDARRRALGYAPVAYDDMYEDTLLDDELKARGLPPSKLLNGKLGETYNAWVKDATDYAGYNDAVTRKMIEKGGKPKASDGTVEGLASNVAATLANPNGNLYTLQDAIAEVNADPKWSEFAHKHTKAEQRIPGQYDSKYVVKETDENGNKFDVTDANGEPIYDTDAWLEDQAKAYAKNAEIANDEFALTLDKIDEYYNENYAITKSDMRAEQWFADNKIALDYGNRFADQTYIDKVNDYYYAESFAADGGYTLDNLFPNAEFTDEERIKLQPLVDEANRISVEQGFSAGQEYITGGGFAAALRGIEHEDIVAATRATYGGDKNGYNDPKNKNYKTDEQILHDHYEKIAIEYGMDKEPGMTLESAITKLMNGEITPDGFMREKCKDTESATKFAYDMTKSYLESKGLPTTLEELKPVVDKLHDVRLYIDQSGAVFTNMGELTAIGHNPAGVRELLSVSDADFEAHYKEEREKMEALPWGEHTENRARYLGYLQKEEDEVRSMREEIRKIMPEYYAPGRDYSTYNYDYVKGEYDNLKTNTLIDLGYALSYTPEFANKTADKDYVNQRFDQIIGSYANSLTEAQDKAISSWASDEDKARLVYMFDYSNGGDETGKAYLNDYMMRKWDALRREEQQKETGYFNSEGKTGFGRWLGGLATVHAATSGLGITEGIVNWGIDTVTLLSGHTMYSSNRSNISKDQMGNLSEHLRDRDGNGIGAFAINLIPSMVQSAAGIAAMYATGGTSKIVEGIHLALMSSQSYDSAVDTALRNGATGEQAYLYGLINAANEAIFEKLSIEKFVKDINVVGTVLNASETTSRSQLAGILAKEMLKHAAVQGAVEASEETLTSIANLLAEQLVLKDKSEFNMTVKRLTDAGMSEEDAKEQAWKDLANSVIMDTVGGLVSGALMSFGGDIIMTGAGRIIVDRSGVTEFMLQTHDLSRVSVPDAIAYAQANVVRDSNGNVTLQSARDVMDALQKQGADASTLSRTMFEVAGKNPLPGVAALIQERVAAQSKTDKSKLLSSAEKYVYDKATAKRDGKATISKQQIDTVVTEWQNRLMDRVMTADLKEIDNVVQNWQTGYITDVVQTVTGSNVKAGMSALHAYYKSLSVEAQAAIKENVANYKSTFNSATRKPGVAASYSLMAAVLEHATNDADALRGLKPLFGDSASVSSTAVRNACLNSDGAAAMAYINEVCNGIAILQSQDGSHLFSAAQTGVNSAAYVAAQMALAQSMPTESMSRAVYDYIVKYGSTAEALDLLTAANLVASYGNSSMPALDTDFKTAEELRKIAGDYQKALANYNSKQAIMAAHEQSDAQNVTEEDARIAMYDTQIAQLQAMVDAETDPTLHGTLLKTLTDNAKARQEAISAKTKETARRAERMESTKADLESAKAAYEEAEDVYTRAMVRHALAYTQRFGAQLQGIMNRDHISHAELSNMTARVMYGTSEDLNAIEERILASEKAAAVALGKALGAEDVECVEFTTEFFDEKNVPESERQENSKGVRIGGKIYLNTKVMSAKTGSLTDIVVLHEIGHILESSGVYAQYAKWAEQYMRNDGEYGNENVDEFLNRLKAKGMSEKAAKRELVAEFTRQIALSDTRAVTALCKAAPQLSMRVFQWLTNTRAQMSATTAQQSKIVVDAQRAFAKGIKAIRSGKVNLNQESGHAEHFSRYPERSFRQQIEEFNTKGNHETDAYVLGRTTQQMVDNHGFTALPITYNQKHVGWNLGDSEPTEKDIRSDSYREEYKDTIAADHRFKNREDVYNLYDKIANPVAIVKNYGKNVGVAFILDVKSESGKQMVAGMMPGGTSYVNDREVRSNVITTVHGRNNVINDLISAIESNNDSVLYWNKELLKKVVDEDNDSAKNKKRAEEIILRDIPGGQFPDHGSTSQLNEQPQDLPDIPQTEEPAWISATPLNRTLSQAGINVKQNFSGQTDTDQFKRWFGDSKAIDESGNPKKLYKVNDTTKSLVLSETDNGDDSYYIVTERPYDASKGIEERSKAEKIYELYGTEFGTKTGEIEKLMNPSTSYARLQEYAAEAVPPSLQTILESQKYDSIHNGDSWQLFKKKLSTGNWKADAKFADNRNIGLFDRRMGFAYYTEYDPSTFKAVDHDSEYMELARKYMDGAATYQDMLRLRSLVDAQALHQGAIGEDFEPLNLYHGNSYSWGFSEFVPNENGLIYTSTDPAVANGYAGVARDEWDMPLTREISTAIDPRLSSDYLDNVSAFGIAKRVNTVIPDAHIAVAEQGAYPSFDRFVDTETGELFSRNKLYARMREAYFNAMSNDELLRMAKGILPNSIFEKTTTNGFDFVDSQTGVLLTRDDLINEMQKESQKGIYHLYGFAGDSQYRTDVDGGFWTQLDDEMGTTTDTIAVNARRQEDVSSARIDRVVDPGGGYEGSDNVADDVIFYDPWQVKSADLVTVDDDGEIIPLSKRFDKNESDIRYYTEYDPQAKAVRTFMDGLTDEQMQRCGNPRMIETDNGFVVARTVSPEGLMMGNPMFSTSKPNIAMIAPVSEFRDGDVGRAVPAGRCKAVVMPNSSEYASLRADVRDAGTSVYGYNESDPTSFDRTVDYAANQSHIQYMPEMGYDEWVAKYGKHPLGAQPRVENRPVPRQTTATNRVSQMAANAASAPVTTEDTFENGIKNWIANGTGTFEPISNARSLDKARGFIERAGSISQAARDLHSDVANSNGKATDLLARAEILYAQSQNEDSGLTDLEREQIFGDMCIIASDAGRALQLASQLKYMTAEGHIAYMEQVGRRMADRYQKRTKKRVRLELTEEEKAAYKGAVTEEERDEIDKKVGERFSDLTSDLTFLDRVRNWRYFSMLGNPRTHFRNIVGNMMMNPVARAKDAINAGYQKLAGIDQSERTTVAITGRVDADVKDWVEEQLQQALPIMQGVSSKYLEEAQKRGDTSETGLRSLWQDVASSAVTKGRTAVGRFLNKLSSFNSNALEYEDAKALGWRFRSSMYQIIKARGLDVHNMTETQRNDIVNYAMEESLRATFRDASALSDAINKFANTNRATQFFMEAIIPFKKTPINIAKRSIEYSPLGLVQGFYKLFSAKSMYNTDIQNGISEQEALATYKRQKIAAIDRLAAGTTGSLLTAIGVFAAAMGWISIGRKDDEEASFEQSLGKNAYSLNIGDLSIDLSAFSPAAVPLLMGAALYGAVGADRDEQIVEALISTLAESVDPITEMSMLSGLADSMKGISYASNEDGGGTRYIGQVAGNAMSSYVGQFIPTFLGQVARVTDPYARSYTAGDDYWATKIAGPNVGKVVKGLQNKIPFVAWLSEPKVDLHGNKVKNYTNWGSYILHPLNNFILPATIKVDSKNEIDDELVRLYGVVDSADIFPTKPSRSLGSVTTKNGPEQIKLTSDAEYTQYQEEYGQTVYDMLEDLMRSSAYKRMNDVQKAEAIEKTITQAKSATKKRWKAQKTANKNKKR